MCLCGVSFFPVFAGVLFVFVFLPGLYLHFHDYSFFVPKNLQNIKVKVEGKLSLTTMKISEQKHYLEDEGAPQKKIDAIKKDKETWLFMATGVIASS